MMVEKLASEVKVGDRLDPAKKVRVHASRLVGEYWTLAYRVKGSKAPGIRLVLPTAKVKVYS